VRAAVLRLAGPLQSYGEQSRYVVRTSQATPTLSALIGLFSAALGYRRESNRPGLGERDWLTKLDLAVRVDRPGTLLEDFQVVAPRPVARYRRHRTSASKVPEAQVTLGSGAPWKVGGRVEPNVSRRQYLADAEFLVFVRGDRLDDLVAALERPRFQLALGRKSCVPEHPLVLGVVDLDEPERQVPTRAAASRGPLRVIRWSPTGAEPPVLDLPAGPSPTDGYLPMRRDVAIVEPDVRLEDLDSDTRAALIEWVRERAA
jgi:CRISPR system Cascade subunit CasD